MSAAKKPSRKPSPASGSKAKATSRAGKTGTGRSKSTAKKKTVAKKKPAATKAAPKKTARKKPVAKKKAAAKKKKPAAKKKAAARKKPAAKKKAVARKKPVAKKKAAAKKRTVAKKKTTVKKGPTKPSARKRFPLRRPQRPGPPRKRIRPMKLDRKILKEIRDQLEGEHAELDRQWKELDRESFDGTQSEMTGEVGLDEDFADAGTATFERERDLSIQNNIKDLMEQITRAIERIDEGVYGTCERCGRPVDAARLRALPHASLCMDCKRREERLR